ncbi:carbonic anhydrase [Humibacter antri]
MTDSRPADAWKQLIEGNARFVASASRHEHQDAARRAETSASQAPVAVILGCSDSRVAPEVVFDQGLGDVFVMRNAGQVVTQAALGTIEYAVALLHTPLLVVLGHESCGAVRAAIDSSAPGAAPLPPNIAGLIAPIVPAVRRVAGEATDPAAVDAARAGREHLRDTVAELLRRSEIVAQAVADGELAIVGANYRLTSGAVEADFAIGEDVIAA